ncbi:hypothetical protein B0H13DRAFT_1862056 [Mycena leptocephala]|nr:hypothetical protein B0H13DRAFT_1862056 [Mycena leptocephala]
MKANDSPCNLSAKTDKFLFDWYDLPENAMQKTRFSFAMACSTNLEPPGAVLSGFKWETLPQDALIVDVGGGVVQDRASVIKDATIYWERSGPDLLIGGNVKLEESYQSSVHDFFKPQPGRNVAGYNSGHATAVCAVLIILLSLGLAHPHCIFTTTWYITLYRHLKSIPAPLRGTV